MKKFNLIILCVSTLMIVQHSDASVTDKHLTFTQIDTTKEIDSTNQLKAAMYLNDCVYTLTRIIESNNTIVLQQEENKLVNNLAWEGVDAFSSICDFRESLLRDLNELVINSTEKERFEKACSKKKNAAAREAILKAISGVHVNTNWLAVTTNALIGAARAYMDYNKQMDDYNDELDEQLWSLKKTDMAIITNLRVEAFRVLREVFGKFGIKEEMRLTESDIKSFVSYLSQSPRIKLGNLSNNEKKYSFFPPYWYELGISYIDMYNNTNRTDTQFLNEAWHAFDRYEDMMKACKLYRTDECLGTIALYKLQYMNNMPYSVRKGLIETVKDNLPNNYNALTYCAIDMCANGDINNGYNLMCQLLSQKECATSNEIILAASAYWNKLSSIGEKMFFNDVLIDAENIQIETYLAFLKVAHNDPNIEIDKLFNKLKNSIQLKAVLSDNNIYEKFKLAPSSGSSAAIFTCSPNNTFTNTNPSDWEVYYVYNRYNFRNEIVNALKDSVWINSTNLTQEQIEEMADYLAVMDNDSFITKSNSIYNTKMNFEYDKFFYTFNGHNKDKGMAEYMPFFEKHKDITAVTEFLEKWSGKIIYKGQTLYYWDKKNQYQSIEKDLKATLLTLYDQKEFEDKIKNKLQKQFSEFYDKHSVDGKNIPVVFSKNRVSANSSLSSFQDHWAGHNYIILFPNDSDNGKQLDDSFIIGLHLVLTSYETYQYRIVGFIIGNQYISI